MFTVEGDLISRCEIFDEADLDAALARFEELHPQAPRLENAASRVDERFFALLRGPRLGGDGRDPDRRHFHDDRRRVVNVGLRRRSRCRDRKPASSGRRSVSRRNVDSLRPAGSASPSVVSVPRAATRSRESSASRCSASSRSTPTSGSRRASCSTWTTSTLPSLSSTLDTSPAKRPPTRTRGRSSRGLYAASDRHELPRRRRTGSTSTTGDAQRLRPGDLIASLRATWDLTPDFAIHIETVHRLTDLGVVITHSGVWDLARRLRRRVA